MDLKKVEILLEAALKENENLKLKKNYENALTKYFEEHNLTEDILNVVTRGMEIDQGANFFEFVESRSKKELVFVWKQVKNNKEIKANKANNGLKLVSGLFAVALTNETVLDSQQSQILDLMIGLIEKAEKENIEYRYVIKDFFVDSFTEKQIFPKWEKIKCSGNTKKQFTLAILYSIEKEAEDKYKNIINWANEGLKSAEMQLHKEMLEAKIPHSRIDELQNILDHYKRVEKQVRNDVYEIDKLEKKAESLQNEILRFQGERSELIRQIENLKAMLKGLEKKLDKAEQIISEHKVLNDTFSKVKKHDEEALLNDIAYEISAEYKDFKESQNDDMDIVLGEIYREKLKNIFKILKRKGIKME